MHYASSLVLMDDQGPFLIGFYNATVMVVQEKLASIPCFMVVNRKGNPYMMGMESGYSVGIIFLDPNDAQEMLDGLVQVREKKLRVGGTDSSFPCEERT